MNRLIARLLKRLAKSVGVPELQARVDRLERHHDDRRVSDDLYHAIEERFRGDPSLIRERQRNYVEHVRPSSALGPILDLGCGRGEWLDILAAEGIPARGVDSNGKFVSALMNRGHDVKLADIGDYIASQPEASLGGITMFQVAEHLPLRVLESVLAEAYRTIAPEGTLVLEIPNIETLRVGAATFWIDPTHERPLFPEFLVFLVERAGFTSIRRVTSTPLAVSQDVLTPVEQELFDRINGPGDFAVIAQR